MTEASGNRAVGAGFTDNILAQTHNLTKPALLVGTGEVQKKENKAATL
ncbi:MAG: hypothetical protein RID53_04245 [Coleofasciculus sp. B1-GNL1-01]